MKKTFISCLAASAAMLGVTSESQAVIIDFNGGTAHLSTGVDVVVTDAGPVYSNVDYYIEDGIKVDFIGNVGIVGNYYGGFTRPVGAPPLVNSVIHAHWDSGITAVKFSKVDGSTLELNYVNLTSNTTVGGGKASGTEESFITPVGGAAVKLPSSDWGIDYLSTGAPGDGIKNILFDSSFDGILSFEVTSRNAFCFGLDDFFIDEPAPSLPDAGSTLALLGLASAGLLGLRRKIKA